MRGLPHSEEEESAWKKVLELIGQFKASDKVVVSTGMWNFSIPYRLKQYLDVIVQPGQTFGFHPQKGYFGLVSGKPVMLLLASGGDYPEGTPGAAFDYQRPYLDMIFRFMGFSDVRVLRSEGTLGPGAETSQAAAEAAAVAAAGGF